MNIAKEEWLVPRPAYDNVQNTLIATCKELFLENGISGTEMQQIATAAGISRSTLYRYVNDKDQLAFMVALDLLFALTNQCLAFSMDSAQNGFQKLSHFAHLLAEEITRDMRFVRFLSEFDLLYGKQLPTFPEAQPYPDFMNKLLNRQAQFLFEGLADGSIRNMDNPLLFNAILIHTIYGLAIRSIPTGLFAGHTYAVPGEPVLNGAIDILLSAIRAEEAKTSSNLK